MESKDRSRLVNMGKHPFKVIVTPSANTTHYYKPSFPCQLIGAKLLLTTAPTAGTVTITKAYVPDLLFAKDKLGISPASSGDYSNNAIMALAATGTTANTQLELNPSANYVTAKELNPETNDALKIVTTSTTLTGATLILEFMPL